MYFILELLGTVAFAISGTMVGVQAHMDMLGTTVLGLTTAVGGGIIRDLLIGVTPPAAFQHPVYALAAIAVSLIVFIPPIRKRINTNAMILILVDAVGLGVFTVTGVQSGIAFSNPFLQIFLGVVTGVGGGVLRDVFAMQKPAIFVRHFYAIASMIGAAVCYFLLGVNENAAMIAGISVIVVLRILAAAFRWHLPKT